MSKLRLLVFLAAALSTASGNFPQAAAEDNKIVKVVGGRYPTSTYARKHGFPGVGAYKDWEQADKLSVEASKLDDAGRWQQAADKFAEAIAIYADDLNFYNNYGLTLLKLHDELGAETAWRYAISRKHDFWQAQNNLGHLLYLQSRLTEAKFIWSKALQSKPPPEVEQDISSNMKLCSEKIRQLARPQ